MTQKKKILILGEQGAFSRRIRDALSRSPDIECVIGVSNERQRERLVRKTHSTVMTVLHDSHSLQRALKDIFAVVNTWGPFLDRDYTVAEQCAELGVHYIDPADTREHATGLTHLARKAEKTGSLIVTGAATAPTLSAALVDMLVPEFDRIREIHACIALSKLDCRELATARAILNYSSVMMRMKEKGRWQEFEGWSKPRPVYFPAPVGRRRGYLCDMLDLDIFPRLYGAQTVTFRTALSSRTGSVVLSLCRWLKRRDMIQNLPQPAALLLRTLSRLRGVGNRHGGLGVEVRGTKDGGRAIHSIFLIARDENSPAIAAAPAVALIKKWAREGVPGPGIKTCVGMLDWPSLRDEMAEYDIVLVRS